MRVLALLAMLAASLAPLPAASITLLSQSAGIFDYAFTLNQGETVAILQNQTIQFTGLSGVTFAEGFIAFSNYSGTNTPTTATFTKVAIGADTFVVPGGYGTLRIRSTVGTTGLVNYAINTSTGAITGQVLGPVAAAVPEPAPCALLSCSLAALWVVRRHRRT